MEASSCTTVAVVVVVAVGAGADGKFELDNWQR